MSVLTQKEKEALEDVFLSIHNNKNIVSKLKDNFILNSSKKDFKFIKNGKIRENFHKFSTQIGKLKNFISK